MKTYERNMADQALIVKSLKVLDKIEGGGVTEIRRDVEAVRQQQQVQNKQQEKYWEDLSSDGIVSAVEKQSLLREMENITRSEAAITAQAATLGYTGRILQDFIDTYGDLRDYLYVTLKLFDNMSEDSAIDDRDTFNTYFSNYYFEENFVLLAITAGILDTLNFRVLESLNEPGEEGETAIYRGGIYQYVNGAWKSVTTGAYKGPRDALPDNEEGAFFIVSDDFTMTDVLYVNDEELYVNNDTLGILHTYDKGMIYYCKQGAWYIEENTSDWKYAAAFADVINITGELPGLFQDAIDNLQSQLDGKISNLPVYYGATSTIPANPNEGDFFCFSGTSYGDWVKSKVYVYRSGVWVGLDPMDTANRNYYMQALEDILAMNVSTNGYFAAIFASAFFANDATLQSLSVRIIKLRTGGSIQSEKTPYSSQTQGLLIDADGNIDANGNTHIRNLTVDNNAIINGSGYIGANMTIKGPLDGCTGTFSGALSGATGTFNGDIDAGYDQTLGLYSFSVNSRQIRMYGNYNANGSIKINGILSYILKSNEQFISGAWHPVDRNGVLSVVQAYIFRLNNIKTIIGETKFNSLFPDNGIQYFSISGKMGIRISPNEYNITLREIGLTRVNNTFLTTGCQIVGYSGDTTYMMLIDLINNIWRFDRLQQNNYQDLVLEPTVNLGNVYELFDSSMFMD